MLDGSRAIEFSFSYFLISGWVKWRKAAGVEIRREKEGKEKWLDLQLAADVNINAFNPHPNLKVSFTKKEKNPLIPSYFLGEQVAPVDW